MNRPFCSTPNAQPGDVGLSHSAKILSTVGFAWNCWAARAAPASVGTKAIVRQRRTEISSGLRDVWVADDFDCRQREARCATVWEYGSIDAIGIDRAGLSLEWNRPGCPAKA